MTDSSPAPLDSLRSRFRLLQIGLFLPVVVTGVLAFAYLRAVRSQRLAVEAAGRQIARRVLEQSQSEASRLGDSAARAILGPVQQVRPITPERIFAAMQRATDSLRRCRCGPLKEGDYFFYWVPSTGAFATSVPLAPERDPRRRVPLPIPAAPGAYQLIWASSGRDATGPWLLHNTTVTLPGGVTAIVGFDISMSSWWTGTILPGLETTRRRFFPMLADSQKAFSAGLMMDDMEVAHTAERYHGPEAGTTLFSVPSYSLSLALNPAILPILVSSATPSYQVLIGALAASLLLSFLALLFLRQLRLTLTRREAFVASITHELRTPLTEVLLHAESLQLDRQTPEAKGRAAASIVRETRRIIALVENALTLAGAGRPANHTRPAPIRPAPVLRESLRSLELAVRQRRARLDLELDEEASCAIDPVSLDRITINLIENGLRYGPEGQTITVRLRCQDRSVLLTVEDQGPGVPPQERHRIWDPFERGSAAGPGTAGVGVGLAIVKHLAELVGGRVGVTEGPGGGARFTISFPEEAISR